MNRLTDIVTVLNTIIYIRLKNRQNCNPNKEHFSKDYITEKLMISVKISYDKRLEHERMDAIDNVKMHLSLHKNSVVYRSLK